MTAALPVVPFQPRKRFEIPWKGLVVGLCALVGLTIAGLAALTLAGKAAVPLPATRGMDMLALAFLVGVGPYALFHALERHRRLALDARLPDFLTDLASLHKAGLTLPDSLLTAAEGNYGPLTKDIRIAADQVRWNIPILVALDNFRARVGTPIAQRSLTVVLEAARTGGNVPEVLDIAAQNTRAFINLREQRRRGMSLYTIITYVASLIFIGVALALQGVFVPRMIDAFSRTIGSGLPLAGNLPTADQFRNLFYTAALVQAIGNGLVGGIMSEGHPLGGLKHAWTMVLLAFLGFLVA